MAVTELRLVLTVDDYNAALAFYRDELGLVEQAAYAAPNGGRVTLLDAGRATLELADAAQAEYIDQVEVGRRVAGQVRVAFQVPSADDATSRLAAAGAEVIAGPTQTPWESINSRLVDLGGVQLTLFEELGVEGLKSASTRIVVGWLDVKARRRGLSRWFRFSLPGFCFVVDKLLFGRRVIHRALFSPGIVGGSI